MANKISLDLSQFKHMKSDKKSTTLQHEKLGHSITLEHSSLSKPDLSALSKMSQSDETPDQANQMRDQKMAKGGKVKRKMMADGGGVPIEDDSVPQGLDPNAPEATVDTAIKPDMNADMNNFNDPAVIAKHQQIAQALDLDPEAFRRGMAIAAGSVGGGVGAEAEEAQLLGPRTIEAESAPAGVGMSNDISSQYGNTIKLPGKDTLSQLPRDIKQYKPVRVMEANGGKIPKYAEGTPDGVPAALDPNATPDPEPTVFSTDPNDVAQSYQQGIDDDISKEKQRLNAPDDSEVPDISKAFQDVDPEVQATKNVVRRQQDVWKDEAADKADEQTKSNEINKYRGRLGLSPALVAGQEAQASQDVSPEQSTPQPANPQDGTEGAYRQAFELDKKGIQGKANALGAEGNEQAKAEDKMASDRAAAITAVQQKYDSLEKERQAHMDDIRNGYIDPNKYWTGDAQGNGSHSKIAAGIGMILAGFNPTNNPNAAISFLNQQMDRNIDAQKQNLSAKQNLLSANLRQFGNLRDATDMTRIMQNDVLNEQLDAAAKRAKGPIAQAEAQQMIASKMKENEQLKFQLGMRRALMSLNSGASANPDAQEHIIRQMQAMDPAQGKAMASRFVKGIGMSVNDVPDAVRQQIATHKSVNDLMNMSLEFSKQHSNPKDMLNPRIQAQASAIQGQLIGQIKQAQHDGVYKPSEADFLTGQIGGSPGSIFANVSSVPKIQQLQQIKQQEYNQLLKSNGFAPQQLPGQQQGPMIKTMGGKQYQKVQGGWVPVK